MTHYGIKLREKYPNGIVPLNADGDYEKILQDENIQILKDDNIWCDHCKNTTNEKTIYVTTIKKYLCEKCLKHHWLFENLMDGLLIKWKENHYNVDNNNVC